MSSLISKTNLSFSILIILSLYFDLSKSSKLSSMSQTFSSLNDYENEECLNFIDSFKYANFEKDRLGTFQTAISWCFNSHFPDMGCKINFLKPK